MRRALLPWIVPALLWLWLGWNLHFEWTLNPQYNYGWAVPLLAALLAWQRWQTRPATATPQPRGRSMSGTIGGAAAAALLVCLLPIRLVEEANPDWRLLSWIFALVTAAYSLVTIWRVAGAGSARHFAFPICFTLVAVPWLVQPENFVVQTFTRAVARVAVEIASWCGLGAYQLGNVIQLRNGFVGVNEACSGVRTLQASLMATLFLGELLRLSAGRRLALVVAGAIWVFLCNVIRATALVLIAGFRGLTSLERWHDFVGWAVLILGMAGVLLAAWLLGQSGNRGCAGGEEAMVGEPKRTAAFRMSASEVGASCAWIALVFAASEGWYRLHEGALVRRPAWEISWPRGSTPLAIPDSTRAMLRFDAAESLVWKEASGPTWWGFFAHWSAGRAALQLVRSHSPDICLPAIGRTFVGERAPADLALPFRVYQFQQEGKPLFVFLCVQDDKTPAGAAVAAPEWSARGRLAAVWQGRRNLGQRLLELAVTDAPDEQAARAALHRTLARILRLGPATGSLLPTPADLRVCRVDY
jgi:exosortase